MLTLAIDHSAKKCLQVLINNYKKRLILEDPSFRFNFQDVLLTKLLRREEDDVSIGIVEILFLELLNQQD